MTSCVVLIICCVLSLDIGGCAAPSSEGESLPTAAVTAQTTSTATLRQPTVAVTRVVSTVGPSPTPVSCTSLPEGMTLQVEPVSATGVAVAIPRLQPGEKLVLIYTSEIPGERRTEIESRPVAVVGVDGRFTERQTNLTPLPGRATNRWEVKVVHARGVACAEVTLPSSVNTPTPTPLACHPTRLGGVRLCQVSRLLPYPVAA